MECTIERGVRKEHTKEVAKLYALAFQNKFKKILGNSDKVSRLFLHTMNCNRGITAISSDHQLIGIAGFQFEDASLINIQLKTMIIHYGLFSGIIKFLLITVIFYRKPDHTRQLLMDGIAVDEKFRGSGIGKLLFQQLEQFAIENNLSSIRLDVIDENSKAKELYERIGFSATKHTIVPSFIFNLIGVKGVTTMVKKL